MHFLNLEYYKGGGKANKMVYVTRKVKIKIELGDIVKRIMVVRGITTRELSRKSGLSRNFISTLLRNQINGFNLRLSTTRNLSTALDVPPGLLYKAPYVIEEERRYERPNE